MNKFILVAISATVASLASADSLVFNGMGKSGTAIWQIGSNDAQNTYAGEMEFTLNHSIDFYGYCDDATVHTSAGHDYDTTVTTTDVLGAVGQKIAYLVNTFAPTVHLSGSNEDALALQLSIWEVEYDAGSTYNIRTGNFHAQQINGFDLGTQGYENVATIADQYLANVGSSVATEYIPTEAGANQSFVAPVPEPFPLAGLAIGVLALVRRRKRA